MNNFNILILRILHKLYTKIAGEYVLPILSQEKDAEKASRMIFDLLNNDQPCMIARFGSTELSALKNYLGVNAPHHSVIQYIRGKQPEWWWNENIMSQMEQWSGFFPSTPINMQRFGDLMIQDIKELDLLGCWIKDEAYFANQLAQVKRVHLRLLEPFWSQSPWTRALEGKRIVVVHPFADTIYRQYNNRTKLFENPNLIPQFKSLRIVKAVQSLGGKHNQFSDWFEALNWMKNEINKEDYDICLIGCGAYGFPLAAEVKRQGKKAVHLGGALQLLFGIKGKRWENPNYGVKEWGLPQGIYLKLMNEFWTIPNESERPDNLQKVEGGCYW